MKSGGNKEVDSLIFGLIDDAIESGSQKDRFFALSTANSADIKHGTRYGRAVLERFVENAGGSFKTIEDGEICMMSTETTRVGMVMVQVAKALDPDFKANLRIAELLDKDSDTTYVHTDKSGEGVEKEAVTPGIEYPDGTLAIFYPSKDKPFVVSMMGPRSDVDNFNLAVSSVICGPDID